MHLQPISPSAAPTPGSVEARQTGCLCSLRDPKHPDPVGKSWVNPSCPLHGIWEH